MYERREFIWLCVRLNLSKGNHIIKTVHCGGGIVFLLFLQVVEDWFTSELLT